MIIIKVIVEKGDLQDLGEIYKNFEIKEEPIKKRRRAGEFEDPKELSNNNQEEVAQTAEEEEDEEGEDENKEEKCEEDEEDMKYSKVLLFIALFCFLCLQLTIYRSKWRLKIFLLIDTELKWGILSSI